jgi:aminopeptidase N
MQQANRGLTLLNQWLSGTSIYTTYQSFVRRIVQQFFDKFGVNSELSEERLDNFAPQIAINLACTMNHQTCLSQSSEKLKEMFQNNLKTYISPDVRSAIYCNGLRSGDSTLFLLMRDKMIKSNDQAERTLLINSLGCAQNENLLNSLLYLAIFEGNNFRLQEKTRVFMAPLNSGLVGLKVMMNFIQLNQQAISEISSSHINTMLTSIASRIPTNSLYTEFKDLLTFLKSINGISDNTQSILLESANSGLKWQSQYLDEISTWLENTENPQVPSTTEESTTTTMTTSTTSSLSTISQSSEPVTTTTSSATSESSVIMETTTEDILTTTQGNADSILISILLIITCSMVEYLL